MLGVNDMKSMYVYNIHNGGIYECAVYNTELEKTDMIYKIKDKIRARNTMSDILIELEGDYRDYTQKELGKIAIDTILYYYQRKYE